MSTSMLFWSAYPELVKWHQRRAPIWLCGPDIAPTVSASLSRTCRHKWNNWPFVGTCTCHSYFKLNYLCPLASLFKLLPQPTPLLCPSYPSLIYADPILMNSMKNHQKVVKISHCLLARLVVRS